MGEMEKCDAEISYLGNLTPKPETKHVETKRRRMSIDDDDGDDDDDDDGDNDDNDNDDNEEDVNREEKIDGKSMMKKEKKKNTMGGIKAS